MLQFPALPITVYLLLRTAICMAHYTAAHTRYGKSLYVKGVAQGKQAVEMKTPASPIPSYQGFVQTARNAYPGEQLTAHIKHERELQSCQQDVLDA